MSQNSVDQGDDGGESDYDSEIDGSNASSKQSDEEENDLYSSEESENSEDPPPDEDSEGEIQMANEEQATEAMTYIQEIGVLNEDDDFIREHQIIFKGQQMTSLMEPSSLNTVKLGSEKSRKRQALSDGMSIKEKSFKYAAHVYKARKCLDNVRSYVDSKDYENQKFYFHKCLDFYKKALFYAVTDPEKARVHFQMGSCFVNLAGVQFESEFRAKYIARACKQFGQCINLAPDGHFDAEIGRESQRIEKFVIYKIRERTNDMEVLQQIFEVLQEACPDELFNLKRFIGEELFEIYFKLALEIDSATGEKSTVLKYLNLCQSQAVRLKGIEDEMVQVKINEIKKALNKKDKEKRLKKALDCESKGDLLLSKGKFNKAIKKYKKAVDFAKDRCAETEASSQLKLGKLYYEKLHDLFNARIHLVDFQLLTFIVKVRTEEISQGFQQARKIMQKINRELKLQQQHIIKPSIKEQEESRMKLILKDINDKKDKCGRQVHEFVDYLLQTYPPKCVQDVEIAATMASAFENPKKVRKSLLRVISYYHPDKQPLDDEVNLKISEEITKHLNAYLAV